VKDLATGEIRTLVRAYDWSQTPLGAAETWSVEVKAAVEILVTDLGLAKTSADNPHSSLFKTQQRYETLYESIGQGFNISEMLFDAHGKPVDYRFLEVNSLFESITGLENAVGKTVLQLIPNLEPFWIETYGRVVLTGEPVEFEHEAKGLNRWFTVKAFPIDAPLEFRFGVLFADITARKLAEDRVKLIQERLEISLAAGDVGVWDLDLVSKQTWRSIGHDRIFGYDDLLPEWTYDQFLSHVIEEDRARVDLAFQNAIAKDIPWQFECGIRTLQGEARWIWGKARTEYDENGQPLRMYGVKRDISDRYREEQNNKFLIEIQSDLGSIADINRMLNVVGEKIRAYYGFSILGFIDVDAAKNIGTTFYMSSDDGEISQVADYSLIDFFSENYLQKLHAGEIVAINDVYNDPGIKDHGAAYKSLPIRSILSLSYVRDREWKFMINGTRPETCIWRKDELELMSELIPRIYLEIERSRSESAIEKVNQRFEAAMLAVEGIIFEWNVDTNFIFRSKGLFNLIGVEAEDAPPTSDWWFNLIHPEDKPNIESFFAQIQPNTDRYQNEYRVYHADGYWIDVWERGNVEWNTMGKIVKVIGFTSDISDRKNAERQLRNSERIYRALGETIKYGIWINDPVGNNIYASQSFLDLVGINQAECSGLDWSYVLHPDEREATIAAWLECVRTKNPWYREQRYFGTDQKYHHVLACGNPVYGDQGEVICWAGINLDVSRFKETEASLRASEERYRSLVELIPQLVWTADRDGKVLDVNQRWLDYTGVTSLAEVIENFGLRSLIHEDDREFLREAWHHCQNSGIPLQAESRIRQHDGVYRWYLHQAVPQKNESGEVLKWYGACTDIDEQKQLESEYANLLQKLQERNQDLDQFSYVVSHDLKTPLRAIANLAEWLEEDLNDLIPPENREQLQLMRSRVFRMEDLINGLLNYARIGRDEIALEEVSLNDLLADIIDLLDPPATFVIETPENLPSIFTKRVLLNQVLANLIGNAIKHHDRQDGKVTISFKDEPDFYEFAIADDGEGIPTEQQSRIFDIFQTLDNPNSKQSTGIGLAIVKKIVETEKGRIKLQSELGKGSTFTFTWGRYSSNLN